VEEFFPLAEERNVGILARVPLASGLLSGKMRADREFSEDDHRNFNREGQAFDKGETFSGVDFETGLLAAEDLKELVPEGNTLAQFALRWILMHPAVSCAIPGGKNISQVEDNVAAAELPLLSDEVMDRVREIYDGHVREEVHHRW
jgi:aryl-alcohol dehydrogenase-like predicted oxidoreductase